MKPIVQRKKRSDKLFSRISASVVCTMRDMKRDGLSLREISDELLIAKSTVSVYCRDLFDHPSRIYFTEEDCRNAVVQRGIGMDHCRYRLCLDCGLKIRNEHLRCAACSLAYQTETGEVARFVEAGKETRFV